MPTLPRVDDARPGPALARGQRGRLEGAGHLAGQVHRDDLVAPLRGGRARRPRANTAGAGRDVLTGGPRPQRRRRPRPGVDVDALVVRRRRRSPPAAGPRRCRAAATSSAGRSAVESVTTGRRAAACAERSRTRSAGDDVDQLGARTMTVRTSRPVQRAHDRRVGQRQRSQLVLGDVGRHLEPGADLARRPAPRRSPTPATSSAGRPRPAGPARRSARGPAAPTSPRRCTARPATASPRPPRPPRAPPGRPAPAPESIALRVGVDQLHHPGDGDVEAERLDRLRRVVHRVVRDPAQRRRRRRSTAIRAARGRRRRRSRQARARNLTEPVGDTSAQSMSSSGGPAKTIVSRTASTPCSASSSDSRTRLPRDLLIVGAVHADHALVQQRGERLGERRPGPCRAAPW